MLHGRPYSAATISLTRASCASLMQSATSAIVVAAGSHGFAMSPGVTVAQRARTCVLAILRMRMIFDVATPGSRSARQSLSAAGMPVPPTTADSTRSKQVTNTPCVLAPKRLNDVVSAFWQTRATLERKGGGGRVELVVLVVAGG